VKEGEEKAASRRAAPRGKRSKAKRLVTLLSGMSADQLYEAVRELDSNNPRQLRALSQQIDDYRLEQDRLSKVPGQLAGGREDD
jgi:hypothetical protein